MNYLNKNKILLIHPLGYDIKAAKRDISRVANIMPPLGLLSIAAYLEKNNITVDLIDCFATPTKSDTIIKDFIINHKPQFVGFSCTTSSFLDAIRISKIIKSINNEIKIVIGGAHVSALKEKIITNFPIIDYTIIGEGEETLLELMNNFDNNLNQQKGIIYRQNNQAIFNGYREKLLDLDTLPFPAYEKLKHYPKFYQLPIFDYPSVPNSSCVSSRGCPYKCSYCDRSVFKSSFRYNSADYLYNHLKYLKERFKIKHINFYDDQFTFNKQRVLDFTELMINSPLKMTYNCAVRAEHIDYNLLQQMKEAGCWMISLGVETGDQNLLAKHRKNPNLEMISEKLHLIKKAKIRTKALLMMGLPYETEESIRKSMDFVFTNPIDTFNLAKFTPFPGSPLYENIHKFGTFEEDWSKMDCMNFLFITKDMTKERLEALFIEFYKSHFKRLKVLLNYVKMLWQSPHSWFRFISNLFHFLKFTLTSKRIE